VADTIFGKIVRGEAPADVVYEDERAMAFRDVAPKAPTHILIVPKKPIEKLADAVQEDEALLGHLLLVAGRLAADAGLEDWRLVVNNGAGAGQTVYHLHLHLLGGRALRWPPG
jgi:histidine triad (HIT) family protein